MILTTQRGRGKKLHLLLDGEYTLTTDIDFWFMQKLPEGSAVTEEQWQALHDRVQQRKAVQKAADLLSRRDHSRHELLQKLTRTFDRETAAFAVDRMDTLGYLDDEGFARRLAAGLIETRRFSVSRVRQALLSKGVAREVVEQVLSEIHVEPTEQILQLLETKYARKMTEEKGRRQTVAALQRLGYGYSDIRSALYRYSAQLDEYEDD